LTVWDSHAINAYLVDQYGSDDALNPKDPKKRALIDAMNHFDTGYLFAGHDALIVRYNEIAGLIGLIWCIVEVNSNLFPPLNGPRFSIGSQSGTSLRFAGNNTEKS